LHGSERVQIHELVEHHLRGPDLHAGRTLAVEVAIEGRHEPLHAAGQASAEGGDRLVRDLPLGLGQARLERWQLEPGEDRHRRYLKLLRCGTN
jgi:hypothetical protein